ncbi:MAG: DUF3143 domain-containing protein [Cyanosarcina radialis HA8281-LM2]|jgi:hypothetical protein|nr:DUF3143 domain-containing protein [Cyanosarcina radialis HA8281-LM2]
MTLPDADLPLYSHPLPEIEEWLKSQGCEQDSTELHCWRVVRPLWKAEIWLDVEELVVRYLEAGEGSKDISRSFRYSLTRQDIEDAVFAGP